MGASDMRAVIQRVSQAQVSIDGQQTAAINKGLLVLLAAGKSDTPKEVAWMAEKIPNLRIFPDESDKMNRSLLDIQAAMIVVSQFTLYGDCRKGRRPSFVQALEPQAAEKLCDLFIEKIRAQKISCQAGQFGANMMVSLTNDGPVTLLVDSSVSRRQSAEGFANEPGPGLT
jgi:D-aminoacyl-tRNA deacylase